MVPSTDPFQDVEVTWGADLAATISTTTLTSITTPTVLEGLAYQTAVLFASSVGV